MRDPFLLFQILEKIIIYEDHFEDHFEAQFSKNLPKLRSSKYMHVLINPFMTEAVIM